MTKKKVLLTAIAALVILLAAFCIYSLLHLGDSQSSEISITQTIDWHDFDYQSEEDMAADADLVLTGRWSPPKPTAPIPGKAALLNCLSIPFSRGTRLIL